MEDNKPEDKYMYEITVETGPLANHATTSKIQFILSGSDCDSGIRTFNTPDKLRFKHHDKKKKPFVPFKRGARDAFLMTMDHPLGELETLRIWTDSSGLGEMSAWYVMSIQVLDIQTGVYTMFMADQWLAIDRGTFEVKSMQHIENGQFC